MYRACIFDLDGTLADTLESLVYSVNVTLHTLEMRNISREECRQFVGDGARKLMERALWAAGDERLLRYEEAVGIFRKVFGENCTYRVKPYDGILQLLICLRQAGIKLGVLTNKPDLQASRVVSEIFGDDVFDIVQGKREGVPLKPDPAGILSIAGKFGVLPQEVLYIGDSEVDWKTGEASGVDTVLVTWGFRSEESLRKLAPRWMVSRAEEILEIAGGKSRQ